MISELTIKTYVLCTYHKHLKETPLISIQNIYFQREIRINIFNVQVFVAHVLYDVGTTFFFSDNETTRSVARQDSLS